MSNLLGLASGSKAGLHFHFVQRFRIGLLCLAILFSACTPVITPAPTLGITHTPTAPFTPDPYAGLILDTEAIDALDQYEMDWDERRQRAEILARARIWVEKAVSYNQRGYKDGYRTDCSGYVSYAWHLLNSNDDPVSPDTVGLQAYSRKTTLEDIRPGDTINNLKSGDFGHTAIFVRWENAKRTVMRVYQENGGKKFMKTIVTDDLEIKYLPDDQFTVPLWTTAPGPYYVLQPAFLYDDVLGAATTAEPTPVTQPTPSPTPQKAANSEGWIVFVAADGNLWRVPQAAPNGTRFTDDANPYEQYTSVKFSPDGRLLAAARFSTINNEASVVVFDTKMWDRVGSVTHTGGGFDWLPDSQTLIVDKPQILEDNANRCEPVFANPKGVFLVNVATKEETEIAPALNGVPLIRPNLSPDGRMLIVEQPSLSPCGDSSGGPVWLYQLDDLGQAVQLSSQYNRFDWSPDGKFLTHMWSSGFGCDPTVQVCDQIISYPVGDLTAGIHIQNQGISHDTSAIWSPDGQTIALARIIFQNGADQQTYIDLVSASDGSRRQIAALHGVPLKWSPDGTTILIANSTAGRYDSLSWLDINSGQISQAFWAEEQLQLPEWNPHNVVDWLPASGPPPDVETPAGPSALVGHEGVGASVRLFYDPQIWEAVPDGVSSGFENLKHRSVECWVSWHFTFPDFVGPDIPQRIERQDVFGDLSFDVVEIGNFMSLVPANGNPSISLGVWSRDLGQCYDDVENVILASLDEFR